MGNAAIRRLAFAFDVDKDAENFIRGTKSVNSSVPTKLQAEFIAAHGAAYDEPTVRAFLESHRQKIGFDPDRAIAEAGAKWDAVGAEFFARADRMFSLSAQLAPAVAYLTTNQRCTYDIPAGYFFVHHAAKSTNRTVMHELLHFYTWHALYAELTASGMSAAAYNDVKESLTELLNVEFADVMPGVRDEGYPQHAAMRAAILGAWLRSRNVRTTVFDVLSQFGLIV